MQQLIGRLIVPWLLNAHEILSEIPQWLSSNHVPPDWCTVLPMKRISLNIIPPTSMHIQIKSIFLISSPNKYMCCTIFLDINNTHWHIIIIQCTVNDTRTHLLRRSRRHHRPPTSWIIHRCSRRRALFQQSTLRIRNHPRYTSICRTRTSLQPNLVNFRHGEKRLAINEQIILPYTLRITHGQSGMNDNPQLWAILIVPRVFEYSSFVSAGVKLLPVGHEHFFPGCNGPNEIDVVLFSSAVDAWFSSV